jgi:hypothetical protein
MISARTRISDEEAYRRATRLGKLQARMHDLGRWRLWAIEREQAFLGEDLQAVFEALQTGDLAYGAQAKLGARRIRSLQRRLDSLARESTDVREKAKAHGVTARLAEQAAETAAALSRRQGAQGARRPHRARHRAPPRKLDVSMATEGGGSAGPHPGPLPQAGEGALPFSRSREKAGARSAAG